MPAECYEGTPFGTGWIEIFHSLPLWQRCFIVFRREEGEWCPNAKFELQDASDVRPGFRVFRIHAKELEFYLTNGSSRNWENNGGKNYVVTESGRYIVSYCNIKRVADADVDRCIRAIRSRDRYGQRYRTDSKKRVTVSLPRRFYAQMSRHVEIMYQASPTWQRCFIIHCKDGATWLDAPGVQMHKHRSNAPDWYFIRLEAHNVVFALNDGGNQWDSNLDRNYKIGIPGKYTIKHGQCKYVGPTELDRVAPKV